MNDKNSIVTLLKSHNLVLEDAISAVIIDGDSAGIVIDLTDMSDKGTSDMPDPINLREKIEATILAETDLKTVSVVITKEKDQKAEPVATGLKKAPDFTVPKAKPAPEAREGAVRGVKHIIAVASGKGGVGKSTTAVNLALALSKSGYQTGILDADIFGPSLPKLLNVNISERPPIVDGVIQPVMAAGMKTMSMGYMISDDQPVVWRGPKVMGAVRQLFMDVDWSGTDILILDLPPGTGDVQLSIAQTVKLSGAIIVSTPQDLALLDARKGLKMFEMVNIPILGLIENMSHFICPYCGTESAIFGTNGCIETAKELGTEVLGQIPLHMSLRTDTHSEAHSKTMAQGAFMLQDQKENTKDQQAIRSTYIMLAEKIARSL